jgi:hypothetical protein
MHEVQTGLFVEHVAVNCGHLDAVCTQRAVVLRKTHQHPITRTRPDCCARDAIGHVIAVPKTRLVNSRGLVGFLGSLTANLPDLTTKVV